MKHRFILGTCVACGCSLKDLFTDCAPSFYAGGVGFSEHQSDPDDPHAIGNFFTESEFFGGDVGDKG
mgnify:CR=1 FL=1